MNIKGKKIQNYQCDPKQRKKSLPIANKMQ
jgi:hypothetical protein